MKKNENPDLQYQPTFSLLSMGSDFWQPKLESRQQLILDEDMPKVLECFAAVDEHQHDNMDFIQFQEFCKLLNISVDHRAFHRCPSVVLGNERNDVSNASVSCRRRRPTEGGSDGDHKELSSNGDVQEGGNFSPQQHNKPLFFPLQKPLQPPPLHVVAKQQILRIMFPSFSMVQILTEAAKCAPTPAPPKPSPNERAPQVRGIWVRCWGDQKGYVTYSDLRKHLPKYISDQALKDSVLDHCSEMQRYRQDDALIFETLRIHDFFAHIGLPAMSQQQLITSPRLSIKSLEHYYELLLPQLSKLFFLNLNQLDRLTAAVNVLRHYGAMAVFRLHWPSNLDRSPTEYTLHWECTHSVLFGQERPMLDVVAEGVGKLTYHQLAEIIAPNQVELFRGGFKTLHWNDTVKGLNYFEQFSRLRNSNNSEMRLFELKEKKGDGDETRRLQLPHPEKTFLNLRPGASTVKRVIPQWEWEKEEENEKENDEKKFLENDDDENYREKKQKVLGEVMLPAGSSSPSHRQPSSSPLLSTSCVIRELDAVRQKFLANRERKQKLLQEQLEDAQLLRDVNTRGESEDEEKQRRTCVDNNGETKNTAEYCDDVDVTDASEETYYPHIYANEKEFQKRMRQLEIQGYYRGQKELKEERKKKKKEEAVQDEKEIEDCLWQSIFAQRESQRQAVFKDVADKIFAQRAPFGEELRLKGQLGHFEVEESTQEYAIVSPRKDEAEHMKLRANNDQKVIPNSIRGGFRRRPFTAGGPFTAMMMMMKKKATTEAKNNMDNKTKNSASASATMERQDEEEKTVRQQEVASSLNKDTLATNACGTRTPTKNEVEKAELLFRQQEASTSCWMETRRRKRRESSSSNNTAMTRQNNSAPCHRSIMSLVETHTPSKGSGGMDPRPPSASSKKDILGGGPRHLRQQALDPKLKSAKGFGKLVQPWGSTAPTVTGNASSVKNATWSLVRPAA